VRRGVGVRPAAVLGLAAAALVWAASPAGATMIDPATLHMGPGDCGVDAVTGCGTEPNIVDVPHRVTIYQQSNSPKAIIVAPLLLILGIPNDTTNLFATDPITGVTFVNPYPGGGSVAGSSGFAGAGTYGLKHPITDAFFGSWTKSSPQLYDYLTLEGPTDASNNWSNWGGPSGFDATASSYGIYVFQLSGASLGPQGEVVVDFAHNLPFDTIAIAYGQTALDTKGNGKIFDTPFTQAGALTATPEPAAFPMFGGGLAALAWFFRRGASRRDSDAGPRLKA
jgi:hypothetical protein